MKIAFKLAFLLSIAFTIGCSSSSHLIKPEDRIVLTDSSISNIEGVYKNSSDSSSNNVNLWRELKPFPKVKDLRLLSDTNNTIKIKLLKDNRILFTLYVDDTLYDTKEIKYEIKDGIVMIKPINNIRFWGIPLIAFKHTQENINLGLDENKNLVVAHSGKAGGGILIIMFGTKTHGYNKLRRVKNNIR